MEKTISEQRQENIETLESNVRKQAQLVPDHSPSLLYREKTDVFAIKKGENMARCHRNPNIICDSSCSHFVMSVEKLSQEIKIQLVCGGVPLAFKFLDYFKIDEGGVDAGN